MNAKRLSHAEQSLPAFELNDFTPYRVGLAASKLSEALARIYSEKFGISIPDWRVLAHLVHRGGVSVRDIELQVAMEKSKVSRAVARLETRGLVKKRPNPQDQRLVQLSLTSKGVMLMTRLLPLAIDFQSRVEAILGGDLVAVEKGLQKLIDEMDDQTL